MWVFGFFFLWVFLAAIIIYFDASADFSPISVSAVTRSGCTERRDKSADQPCTWQTQFNSDQMLKIATSAQTRTAHYTLSSHPLHRTHRYTLSDPSQLHRGGKGQRSRVRTLRTDTWTHGIFCTQEAAYQGFRKRHAHLYLEYAGDPITACVCWWLWENELRECWVCENSLTVCVRTDKVKVHCVDVSC